MKYKSLLRPSLILLATALLATGCMKGQTSTETSSEKAAEAIGCDNFKSKVYDSMYDYLDNENIAPELSAFSSSLNEKIDQIAKTQKIDNPKKIDELKNNITQLYQILIEKSAELKQTKTSKEHLQTLIEMEMEDTSSLENIKLNQASSKAFANINQSIKALDVQCGTSTPQSPPTNSEPEDPVVSEPVINPNPNTDPNPDTNTDAPATVAQKNVIVGSHNVLATAYQSCAALEIPDISAATDDVQGIERYGTHEDGIGGKRRVASLSSVQSTHPYIKVAGGSQSGCFNVRNNPLIYDYGGSAAVSNNIIDFSKNSGSGSTALGIDCSAYVSASIAAGGLRYKPGVENKAIYIRQNSSKFINAKSSGFDCFNNVTMSPNESIKPGDIVGVKGHVVIVDQIGTDPFGLKKFKSISDCDALTISNFDFSVSQSSPSKGGIGLNKYVAKDYLRESTKMTEAFLGFAKAACQAYFTGKKVSTPSSSYGILRHNGTASCLSPKIQMAYQGCVRQCMQ